MDVGELARLLIEWREARMAMPPPHNVDDVDNELRFRILRENEKRYEHAEEALVKWMAENSEALKEARTGG